MYCYFLIFKIFVQLLYCIPKYKPNLLNSKQGGNNIRDFSYRQPSCKDTLNGEDVLKTEFSSDFLVFFPINLCMLC